ncbi:MAG: hypothetical protein HKN32_09575 [Flavobacteriales bacterium]|nr:hypothetical protein [Flavobacteriales bacterium]
MKELARENQIPTVEIPGGNPPRAMLAYSLIQLISIFQQNGLCAYGILKQVEKAGEYLAGNQESIQERSSALAAQLKGRIPVIYIASELEPIAIRWRQQINENSKMVCWHHVFPEMNHNELVGWDIAADNISVVMIRTEDDFDRTSVRMDICKDIFKKKAPVHEVHACGNDSIERAFYLIHFGDWLSIELATLNGVDPVAIDNIIFLKDQLSEIV